jgi:archaellum biogenesis protein FlaJ (TadC family)
MSIGNRTIDWILAILLIIVIIVSGVGIYYSSAIIGKLDEMSTSQDENYAALLAAIASSGATSESLLEALLDAISGLNICTFNRILQGNANWRHPNVQF